MKFAKIRPVIGGVEQETQGQATPEELDALTKDALMKMG